MNLIVTLLTSIIFASIPLGYLYYLYKMRTSKIAALVKIVELGGDVNPETMKLLSREGGNYKTDYKYAMFWIAVGIPLFISIGVEEGIRGAAPALIPVFIGIAYAITGKYRFRESD